MRHIRLKSISSTIKTTDKQLSYLTINNYLGLNIGLDTVKVLLKKLLNKFKNFSLLTETILSRSGA